MNLKKVIKYSALGLVAVLATSALVACSSGKSASGKKTIEVGTVGTTKPFSYEEKDGKLTAARSPDFGARRGCSCRRCH